MDKRKPSMKPLVRADGLVAPQYFNERTGEWEYITGVDGAMHYVDEHRSRQHFVYSTEERPKAKKGDALLELDTSEVYVYDGEKWVVI